MAPTSKLLISKELSLPINVVTQKLAWMGRTGSGKTYGFGKLAEEMLSKGIQVVILDPVGIHWGLRLAANGKDAGIKNIYVFGGLHKDIPLEPTSGKLIADFIADRNVSAILDVSQFESDADKTRFATDWCSRFFFRYKSKPSPVHVCLEECQEFIPQNGMKGEERMIHAFNRMWKIGRNFGIGGSLISQRPQEVNKKALNQTECFFAFQMTAPHERKAVEEWMKEKGVDLTIADDLPKLEIGSCHVWSPQWLKISKEIKIEEKWTYNASSTPQFGSKQVQMKALEPLEIEKLSTELKASIEKARESDPDILHKKIRELQTEVNKKLKIVPQTSSIQIDQHAIDKAVEQVRLQYEAKIEKAKREIELIRHSLGKKVVDVFLAAKALEEVEFPTFTDKLRALDLFKAEARKELISPVENNYKYKITAIRKDGTRIEQAKDSHILLQPTDSIKLLPSGARRLLEVLVAWHPNSLSEGHWRSNAGLRKTGTFSNYKSTLITQGLISRDGDKYIATQSGIDYFGDNRPTAPQTTAEVLALWMNKLPEGARRILSVLIDVNGDFIGEDELLYKSELKKTGTFSNYKSMLMIAKLIKKNGNTYAADKETLFL